MKEHVVLASLEASQFRYDFKVKSGSMFEIYKILNRELDLETWLPWITENNIELQFGYWLNNSSATIVYRVWAVMTPEQATFWKLTWGYQNKVII